MNANDTNIKGNSTTKRTIIIIKEKERKKYKNKEKQKIKLCLITENCLQLNASSVHSNVIWFYIWVSVCIRFYLNVDVTVAIHVCTHAIVLSARVKTMAKGYGCSWLCHTYQKQIPLTYYIWYAWLNRMEHLCFGCVNNMWICGGWPNGHVQPQHDKKNGARHENGDHGFGSN